MDPGRTAHGNRKAARALRLGSGALSLAAVERLLGLPSGAARRRRLFLVHVRAPAIAGTNIRGGDRLVVEPGNGSTPGRLVLYEKDSHLGVAVMRIDSQGRHVLSATDPEELPFPVEVGRLDVLGTVIAVLASDTIRRERGDRAANRASTRMRTSPACAPREEPRSAREMFARIERWLTAIDPWIADRAGTAPTSTRRQRWRRLRNRLRTLCACLEGSETIPLRSALSDELARTLKELEREARLAGYALPVAQLSEVALKHSVMPPRVDRVDAEVV